MYARTVILRGASTLLVLLAHAARADNDATSPMRPDYDTPFHLFDWQGRNALEHRGLTIDPVYTIEGFASRQLDREVTVGGLFVLELDADLDMLIDPALGHLHITGVAIHGTGPNNELADVHNSSGNAAPPGVRLFEAWYEQPIGLLTLRLGLLSADQEFWIARHATTLMAATFGMPGQFGYTVANPTYPVGTPAASARVELDDITARVAVYDGTQTNTHGIPTDIGPDVLAFGELTIGELSVGGWQHSELGRGVYATADTDLSEDLGAFARAGYSNTTVPLYIDAGIRTASWRPHDVVSVGMAFAQSDQGAQTLVEATYTAQLGWLRLQPDLQLLLLRDRTVGIVATRATFVF